MVGIAEISAGLGSLKTAKDIVQGINAAASQAAINEIRLNLQGHLLEAQQALFSAQEAHTALTQRISALEEEIVRLKDWSAERERYHLVDVYRGSLTYMPKPGVEGGQPAHWLCANCFDQRRKSYLQFKGQDETPRGGRGMESTYGCDACKSSIKVSYRSKPAWPGDDGE